MHNTLLILELLVIMFCILGAVVGFAANRRLKCKKMIIRDMANPNNPIEKFYAKYDKRSDSIHLFANLFYPFKSSMEPPFNMKAYVENGTIKCLRGVTGNPDDRNIVPVRTWPIVGRTGAKEFSSELAGAVANTEAFIKQCEPFRVGQEVEFIGKHKGKEITSLKGQIVRIGYEGIVISYDKVVTDKEGNATAQKVEIAFPEPKQIEGLKTITAKEDVLKLPVTPLTAFFDAEWVMNNLGVIPVDEVNAVLESEKSAVAQYNSSVESRQQQRLSWAARHGPELLIITFFAVTVVLTIIYWQSIDGLITSHVNAALGVVQTQSHNTVLSNLLPVPT